MPQIAELKEIDGEVWARIPLSGDQGHVQLLSETEIAENGRKLDKLLAENERLRALVAELADGLDDALMYGANRDLVNRARSAFEQRGPSKEWCEAAAKREGNSEVGAGLIARDPEQKVGKI